MPAEVEPTVARGQRWHDLHHSGEPEYPENDEHQRDRQLHRQADPRRDHDVEQQYRPADEQDRRCVPQPPHHPYAAGATNTPLTADDGGHGHDVIGVRRVTNAEHESKEGGREDRRHVALLSPIATCREAVPEMETPPANRRARRCHPPSVFRWWR